MSLNIIHDNRVLAHDSWQIKVTDIQRVSVLAAQTQPVSRGTMIHILLISGGAFVIPYDDTDWEVARMAFGLGVMNADNTVPGVTREAVHVKWDLNS